MKIKSRSVPGCQAGFTKRGGKTQKESSPLIILTLSQYSLLRKGIWAYSCCFLFLFPQHTNGTLLLQERELKILGKNYKMFLSINAM
jgi:hypothetical protein